MAARGGAALWGFDRRGRPVEEGAGAPAGSAAARLVAEVIAPLGIGAHDVLVIAREDGDASGAGGVEGARVGPAALREVLELQRRLDEELAGFAPQRDAAWVIEEAGFDLAREHEIESLLSFASALLGFLQFRVGLFLRCFQTLRTCARIAKRSLCVLQ